MARVSININVLDGGRSVWAAADIGFPFCRPLDLRQPIYRSDKYASLVESFRNATKSRHES
jgi:hypothetical protein